jgi:hypothetical protein
MFEDNRISYKAKGLLGYMLSRPDNWKIVMQDLINRSTDGETSVKSAIKELKNAGYLSIKRLRNEKGEFQGSAIWEYDDIPLEPQGIDPKVENPLMDNQKEKTPLMDNPLMDNPLVENHPYINNTNCNNTDINNIKDKELVNKAVNKQQKIIDELILEYMKKGLSKDLCLRVIAEINFEGIKNAGGYLRACLENVLHKHKLKNGTAEVSTHDLLYNWLE